MSEDLKVTVGADVKPLIDAMNAAGGSTKKFADVAARNISTAAAKIKTSSNTAGFALQNLGRVAQDLPFGFVGIANNLNPLLESFQRLRKESGSTGGALKLLAGSLGGGIKICEGWKKDVTVFYNWAINNGWAEGLQIDRINNNGNYEPANCRFVTPAINGLNRRNNVYVNYRGKIVALGLLAKEYNLNRATLLERVNKGWDIKKAVTTKTRKWSRV